MYILVVDDDQTDRMAAERAFERYGIRDRLFLASGGEEALARLRGESAPIPRPVTILLDLRMPRMDGLEFLRQLRADPKLRDVPVVVTTNSTEAGDIETTCDLGTEGYIIKPVHFDTLAGGLACDETGKLSIRGHLRPPTSDSAEYSKWKPNQHSRRILSVDDSATFRAVFRLAFEKWTNVDVASSPLTGLKWALKMATTGAPYQGFVLDIVMQPFNGFELARVLRELGTYRSTPILFLTGGGESSGQADIARELGGHVIAKVNRTSEELRDAVLAGLSHSTELHEPLLL